LWPLDIQIVDEPIGDLTSYVRSFVVPLLNAPSDLPDSVTVIDIAVGLGIQYRVSFLCQQAIGRFRQSGPTIVGNLYGIGGGRVPGLDLPLFLVRLFGMIFRAALRHGSYFHFITYMYPIVGDLVKL